MKDLLLLATQKAAIAASKHIGCGDKNLIDSVAVNAMREVLNDIDFLATIVIGEGKKDNAPMLGQGEKVGKNSDNDNFSIAVDPVEGTTQVSKNGFNAISVLAVGDKNAFLATDKYYMQKIAVGNKISAKLFLDASVEETVNIVKKSLNRDITVCVLNRPRHNKLIAQLRGWNCTIKLIEDCDIVGALETCIGGVDLFMSIGGAPEGVLTAAAIKCLGGQFLGRLVDNKTYQPIDDNIYSEKELAKGDVMFFATGITNGSLLHGVEFNSFCTITNSLIIESKVKTEQFIRSWHKN